MRSDLDEPDVPPPRSVRRKTMTKERRGKGEGRKVGREKGEGGYTVIGVVEVRMIICCSRRRDVTSEI